MREYKYYVTYSYAKDISCWGVGCTEIKTNKKMDTFESILNVRQYLDDDMPDNGKHIITNFVKLKK